MSSKTNTAKIGLFVILAVIILIAGLLAFGAKSFFTNKTKLETAFPGQVYGLSVGSPVQLRGVPIGKVTRVTFAWHAYPETQSRLVVVEFEVEGPLLPLPKGWDMKKAVQQGTEKGLRALTKSQGITGTSLLALEMLDPTNYPPMALDYNPRHLYIPSGPGQISRMLESVEKSLSSFQQLDFPAISQNVTNNLGALRELLEKVNKLDLAMVVSNANGLLTDLKGTSAKATTLLADVQTNLASMKLDTLSTNANHLLVNLRETSSRAQIVLAKFGTVPLDETMGDLRQVLKTLDAVLVDLKQYPSGFIFGDPPRPINGTQPEKQ